MENKICNHRFLNNRLVAQVSLSLHRLLDEPRVELSACLLDQNNKPTKVRISSIIQGDMTGILSTSEPATSYTILCWTRPAQQHSLHGGPGGDGEGEQHRQGGGPGG